MVMEVLMGVYEGARTLGMVAMLHVLELGPWVVLYIASQL
jgi:hypothetical protein